MRQTHDPTPNARLRLAPILWLICAMLGVVSVAVGGMVLTQIVTVPQTQTFMGTLQKTETAVEMPLPAGLPLKSILVKAGEPVRAGQTVALLDETIMRAQHSQIERSIEVASVLRACLLALDDRADIHERAESGSTTSALPERKENDQDRELRLLVRAANADCRAAQRHDENDVAQLRGGINVLQDRLSLTEQKLAMALGVQRSEKRKSVDPFMRAHASVSIALERNDLTQKLFQLNRELGVMRAQQDRIRLSRVTFLSKDVAQKLTQKAVLETYLENPRLAAPHNGRVRRVRPVLAGAQFDSDETIIEILGAQASAYVAELRIPVEQAERLPIGTEVALSLAGFTRNAPRLRGTIEHWTTGGNAPDGPYAKARVSLTEASQERLSDPQNGIALGGASTASAIRAELAQKTLEATLKDAFWHQTTWAGRVFANGEAMAKLSMQHPM